MKTNEDQHKTGVNGQLYDLALIWHQAVKYVITDNPEKVAAPSCRPTLSLTVYTQRQYCGWQTLHALEKSQLRLLKIWRSENFSL